MTPSTAASANPVPPHSASDAANVTEIRSAVRRFIGARVADAATADDLTQEVFVKMQTRLSQVRDPRRLMGWIIQIARNTVADHFRGARSSEAFDEERGDGATSVQPEWLDKEESQLRQTLNAYVRSVVEGLPLVYRDALIRTDFDGLTQVELANHLGLSVSAIKSRVQRARAMVRDRIDRCCHVDVDHYGTVVEMTPKTSECDC